MRVDNRRGLDHPKEIEQGLPLDEKHNAEDEVLKGDSIEKPAIEPSTHLIAPFSSSSLLPRHLLPLQAISQILEYRATFWFLRGSGYRC